MRLLRFALVLVVGLCALPASAAPQNDAGLGRDASNTFAAADELPKSGRFDGRLDAARGDVQDYYGFRLNEGEAFSVLVAFPNATTDPVELLDPTGILVDAGMRFSGVGVAQSSAFTAASVAFSGSQEVSQVRLAVHRALRGGLYRLRVRAERNRVGSYSLCVMNCDQVMQAGNDLIFGGSLKHLNTRVLLIPPSHGDLGNPLGPTVVDYIEATLRGIHGWTAAMHAFANEYPQYSYLKRITIEVVVFDDAVPVDPAGFDVLIGYVAAGPAFRGIASDPEDLVESFIRRYGLDDEFHYSGRVIALSLYGSAPRAGQVMYDFPEVNDLEIVTMHEFGHTFGLGHTRWWDPVLGPDLMNSPAPFIYGDGSAIGDGGVHTAMRCLSSLNLVGMAELYRWVPAGEWQGSGGSVDLPEGMPYKWYCSS